MKETRTDHVFHGPVRLHPKSTKCEFRTLEQSANVRVRRFSLAAFKILSVKEVTIQAVMGQNRHLQGFYGVTQAWLYLASGIQPIEISTGTELVTPKNMGPYMEHYNINQGQKGPLPPCQLGAPDPGASSLTEGE
jgi:hypothetical protein